METETHTFDCGCHFIAATHEYRWEPCPLHKAAPELLEALEQVLKEVPPMQ